VSKFILKFLEGYGVDHIKHFWSNFTHLFAS